MPDVFNLTEPQGSGVEVTTLPKQTRNKEHFEALPYADIPATIDAIRASNSNISTKLATEFLILTAARAGEVRLANWTEIDWESATWTVSAENARAPPPQNPIV